MERSLTPNVTVVALPLDPQREARSQVGALLWSALESGTVLVLIAQLKGLDGILSAPAGD